MERHFVAQVGLCGPVLGGFRAVLGEEGISILQFAQQFKLHVGRSWDYFRHTGVQESYAATQTLPECNV